MTLWIWTVKLLLVGFLMREVELLVVDGKCLAAALLTLFAIVILLFPAVK